MIRFMMKEADKMIKGPVHEENFCIVHDVLVLMKSKETITWMKGNNQFRRWLIPINGF